MNNNSCCNCRFYTGTVCRRYPAEIEKSPLWWCGEFARTTESNDFGGLSLTEEFFSVRELNGFSSLGIRSVNDLLATSVDTLRRTQNFGERSLNRTVRTLSRFGLELRK